MSAVPPKAEANSRHQRYRALEVIAGTLERRTIDFMGADRIARSNNPDHHRSLCNYACVRFGSEITKSEAVSECGW